MSTFPLDISRKQATIKRFSFDIGTLMLANKAKQINKYTTTYFTVPQA